MLDSRPVCSTETTVSWKNTEVFSRNQWDTDRKWVDFSWSEDATATVMPFKHVCTSDSHYKYEGESPSEPLSGPLRVQTALNGSSVRPSWCLSACWDILWPEDEAGSRELAPSSTTVFRIKRRPACPPWCWVAVKHFGEPSGESSSSFTLSYDDVHDWSPSSALSNYASGR